MLELFKIFFALGWVSFGGPAAHIGYFRKTFVEKRNWMSEEQYAQLIALSQCLPGPGSSQIGFAIGYQRLGLIGGLIAFLAFTLPSIILMILLASVNQNLFNTTWMQGIIHGLKLLAVVVVCDATLTMFKQFCQSRLHRGLCVITACVCLLWPSAISQILCLMIAALLCRILYSQGQKERSEIPSKKTKTIPFSSTEKTALFLFSILFMFVLFVPQINGIVGIFKDFYLTGSLVFGGGHVVLPLLQSSIGQQLTTDTFLTGYAAAQAMPGPMFTFATFLGYALLPNSPILGAIIATIAIFLPGFLLVVGFIKQWQSLMQKPSVMPMISGVNAAVVGLLLAALYQPIFISAVQQNIDLVIVLIGLLIIRNFRWPIVSLVSLFIVLGFLSSL